MKPVLTFGERPEAVTRLGSGLDMDPRFRNIHDIPLKQTKVNLVDSISGSWFLNQGTLYRLSDGMNIKPVQDKATQSLIERRFDKFRALNNQFADSQILALEAVINRLTSYRMTPNRPVATTSVNPIDQLAVTDVRIALDTGYENSSALIDFSNTVTTDSAEFVSLIVLMGKTGRELAESYGRPMQLAASTSATQQVFINAKGIPPGEYFLAVIPSKAATGKSLGAGK